MKIGIITICIFVIIIIFTLIMLYLDNIKYLYYGLTKKKRIQHKLKKIAKDNDFILLEDLVLYFNDREYIKVDYLMISNKYIYVIAPRSYYGDIDGRCSDEMWLLYQGNRLKHIENPLKYNLRRTRVVVGLTNIEEKNFINLVIINKPAFVNDILSDRPNEYVVEEDNLRQTIDDIERFSKLDDFTTEFMEKEANLIYRYSNECKEKLQTKASIK